MNERVYHINSYGNGQKNGQNDCRSIPHRSFSDRRKEISSEIENTVNKGAQPYVSCFYKHDRAHSADEERISYLHYYSTDARTHEDVRQMYHSEHRGRDNDGNENIPYGFSPFFKNHEKYDAAESNLFKKSYHKALRCERRDEIPRFGEPAVAVEQRDYRKIVYGCAKTRKRKQQRLAERLGSSAEDTVIEHCRSDNKNDTAAGAADSLSDHSVETCVGCK